LNGEDSLKCRVEARVFTREAEVVSVASHAVYKEHIYLLVDNFTIKEMDEFQSS